MHLAVKLLHEAKPLVRRVRCFLFFDLPCLRHAESPLEGREQHPACNSIVVLRSLRRRIQRQERPRLHCYAMVESVRMG